MIDVIKLKHRAKWYLAYYDDDIVFIVDEDAPNYATVTTAAEQVIADIDEQVTLGNRRLYYRDSEGRIDELTHRNGKFTGFRPGPPAETQAELRKCVFCGEIW